MGVVALLVWLSHRTSERGVGPNPPIVTDVKALSLAEEAKGEALERSATLRPNQTPHGGSNAEQGGELRLRSSQNPNAPFPTNVAEVRDFLRKCSKRSGSQAFFSAVEAIYEAEARDDAWARPVEEAIRRALSVGDVRMRSGECHASLCRYIFDVTTQSPALTLLQLGQRLTNVPPPGVDGYYRPEGPTAYAIFVFSLDPNAPYLVDLYRTFEGAN